MTMPPPEQPSRWSDHEVEQLVGNLLRYGVLIAAAITVVGGIMLLVQHGGKPADYHVFASEPGMLRSVGGIIRGAVSLDSRAIVQLGLLFLIATPIARVAFSLVAFAIQRDRLYVVTTLLVLAILLYSLFFSTGA